MAWKNGIITHFPNIWMKRFSCLEYSKIRGSPNMYSNLKCRRTESAEVWTVADVYSAEVWRADVWSGFKC